MRMGYENFSMRGKMQTLSDGSVVSDPRVEVRRRNRGTVLSAMLVLLTILTASTWLGCVGERPPPAPADPSECSNGTAVPNPSENPGLVEDCETLLLVRDTLAVDRWLYWNGQKSIQDWEGVTVDAEKRPLRVTGLDLAYKHLAGEIPAELGQLTNLVELNLDYNELTGKIPVELFSLTDLVELRLSLNRLTGEIPVELSKLTKLEAVSFGKNQLNGEIPSELGNLSKLRALRLEENQLTGEIPLSLGRLANLMYLHLNGNQLTGGIPSELGSLPSLIELLLSENKLTGAIPAELGGLYVLQWLNLRDNLLAGEIPAELGNLRSLEMVVISANQLTGDIPAELGNLSNLRLLNLANNRVGGCIPARLRSVKYTDLAATGLPYCDLTAQCSNGIAVANPQENAGLVADCAVLLELRDKLAGDATLNWSERIAIREWNGVGIDGATEPPRVTALKLVDRGLTGEIPAEIGGFANLQILDLSWNSLAGEVPDNLNNLSNLRTLRLAGNQLSGCLPQTWRNVEDSDLAETGLAFCE